jgi:hypothetical protein
LHAAQNARDVASDSFRLHPGQIMLGDGPFVASLTDGTALFDGREHRGSTIGLYRLRGEQIADRIWSIGR